MLLSDTLNFITIDEFKFNKLHKKNMIFHNMRTGNTIV